MFAVGRLGTYISRGVYTVSGPFHPFGGAVDIVVVEQPDGTYKSAPWYVRFGKFQGVLKASEKVVSINVNGVDADFNMYLDHKGEAFFLRDVDASVGDLETYSSSGDEMNVKADLWRHQKSKSCNFDSSRSDLVSDLEQSNGKNLPRNNSRRGRLFGLSFGRRSIKENGFQDREGGPEVDRVSSMERAEIAADLLEVRWTTNLRVGSAKLPPSKPSVTGAVRKAIIEDGVNNKKSSVTSNDENEVNSCVSNEHVNKKDTDIPTSTNPGEFVEIFSLEETYMRVGLHADISPISTITDDGKINGEKGLQSESSSVCQSSAELPLPAETQGTYGEEHICSGRNTEGGSSREGMIGVDRVDSANTSSTGGDADLCNTNDVILTNDLGASEANSTGTGDPSSLPIVAGVGISIGEVQKSPISFSAEECSGESTSRRNSNLTSLDNLEEEQFSFSDLDGHKIGKDESLELLSLGGKVCDTRDLQESSGDELTEKDALDDRSHHLTGEFIPAYLHIGNPSPKVSPRNVSSPISISKHHTNADGQATTLVSESFPNKLYNDGDLISYKVSQLLGRSLDSNLEAIKLVNDVLVASELDAAQQEVECVQRDADDSCFSEEIEKIVSDPAVDLSLCRHLLYDGMGYEAAGAVFDAAKLDIDKNTSLSLEIVKDEKLVVRIGGLYFPWEAALPIVSAIGSQGKEQILEPKGMIAVGQVDNQTADEGGQTTMNSRSGSWKMWPFSFKRSNSIQDKGFDSENSESSVLKVDYADVVSPKVSKKKVRAKAPTSEQLASLNLKEGKNEVTFTFSTAMLGKQQVDARIFLWKWNTRIVISDVDGTITKSDVLGQFMPLMGIDWSQTGVTHLFSAIKENGYQVLFLSARSISQACQTRQFLLNLKQDGKELPEGPVLISPDGLFPSLYREVIRRAPHEFKISCLEDVKSLFPPDHNPFYAGFGNRDTDEISYLKVGIPIGKIFIINPKGQIAVNRRVDTKSYTNLHALVHGMFPPAPPPEQEDYNSWNFWRLPPPDVL